jgi:hypothetical protein
MATFSYTGMVQIKWKNGDVTVRFVDWEAGRDTLTVWPEEGEIDELLRLD